MYIDDLTLQVVGNDVPSTNILDEPSAAVIDSAATVALYRDAFTSPANSGFERIPELMLRDR